MAEINLTQAEADDLMAMEKICASVEDFVFTNPGEKLSIELLSRDKRERFLLDISRARIDLSKVTYQNRARQAIVLLRLDLGGPPHRNPDDTLIACHICMFIKRDLATNGPIRRRQTSLKTHLTFSQCMNLSSSVATSRKCQECKGGYSDAFRNQGLNGGIPSLAR